MKFSTVILVVALFIPSIPVGAGVGPCDWDYEMKSEAISALEGILRADPRFAGWDFDLPTDTGMYNYVRLVEYCVIPVYPPDDEPGILGVGFDHETGMFVRIEPTNVLFADCPNNETGDSDIVQMLQSITPPGMNAYETISTAVSRYVRNAPGQLSSVSFEDGKWRRGGRPPTYNSLPDGAFAITLLLLEDSYSFLSCTTHIYGSWYFDQQHKLVDIQIERHFGPIHFPE